MPAFDPTVELPTRFEDAVVVVLVVRRSRYAVSEHAFRQGRQGVRWVRSKEGGSAGGVSLRYR